MSDQVVFICAYFTVSWDAPRKEAHCGGQRPIPCIDLSVFIPGSMRKYEMKQTWKWNKNIFITSIRASSHKIRILGAETSLLSPTYVNLIYKLYEYWWICKGRFGEKTSTTITHTHTHAQIGNLIWLKKEKIWTAWNRICRVELTFLGYRKADPVRIKLCGIITQHRGSPVK